jgi:hypothetical protein
MNKSKVHNAIVINNATTRPFRKMLVRSLRKGFYALRVYGKAGAWYLGVQRGNHIHRISGEFKTQLQATLQGYAKYKMKATQYKGKAAA